MSTLAPHEHTHQIKRGKALPVSSTVPRNGSPPPGLLSPQYSGDEPWTHLTGQTRRSCVLKYIVSWCPRWHVKACYFLSSSRLSYNAGTVPLCDFSYLPLGHCYKWLSQDSVCSYRVLTCLMLRAIFRGFRTKKHSFGIPWGWACQTFWLTEFRLGGYDSSAGVLQHLPTTVWFVSWGHSRSTELGMEALLLILGVPLNMEPVSTFYWRRQNCHFIRWWQQLNYSLAVKICFYCNTGKIFPYNRSF